ncbi:hypothetical protein IHI24_000243 [Rickettsia endosymbiont of Cardiosporidium cionae]|nr:hypothetical protein IHI24_000243 [Rickettsia endosymbiont of Cardiosporidium cionae]
MLLLTASARLDGNVHGVVVQANILYSLQFTGAFLGLSLNINDIVIALSARLLYALSIFVSKLDKGVSQAQE